MYVVAESFRALRMREYIPLVQHPSLTSLRSQLKVLKPRPHILDAAATVVISIRTVGIFPHAQISIRLKSDMYLLCCTRVGFTFRMLNNISHQVPRHISLTRAPDVTLLINVR